jgi:glycosyltransferase involved in cell wall biosynthesis
VTNSHSGWNFLFPKCLQSKAYALSTKPIGSISRTAERHKEAFNKLAHLEHGVSVLVPAFKEEETIARCVTDVTRTLNEGNLGYEIIIVDDGSPDRTFELAKDAIKSTSNSIKVVRRSLNGGKGQAVMTGLSLAAMDIIVIQDADLEYSSKNIPMLVEPILKGKADVVYGSRFLGQIDHMSLSHLLGNKILTFFINLLYRCKLTDVMTGHKAFRKDVLDKIAINAHSFEFEVEVTAKILEHGFKIVELPTSYTRRSLGKAKIKWIDGIKCLIWLIHHKFASRTRHIQKAF